MYAFFGAQVAVGVASVDSDGHTFDAGLFTRRAVNDLNIVVVLFHPAQVHTLQHLSPVL